MSRNQRNRILGIVFAIATLGSMYNLFLLTNFGDVYLQGIVILIGTLAVIFGLSLFYRLARTVRSDHVPMEAKRNSFLLMMLILALVSLLVVVIVFVLFPMASPDGYDLVSLGLDGAKPIEEPSVDNRNTYGTIAALPVATAPDVSYLPTILLVALYCLIIGLCIILVVTTVNRNNART